MRWIEKAIGLRWPGGFLSRWTTVSFSRPLLDVGFDYARTKVGTAGLQSFSKPLPPQKKTYFVGRSDPVV